MLARCNYFFAQEETGERGPRAALRWCDQRYTRHLGFIHYLPKEMQGPWLQQQRRRAGERSRNTLIA